LRHQGIKEFDIKQGVMHQLHPIAPNEPRSGTPDPAAKARLKVDEDAAMAGP